MYCIKVYKDGYKYERVSMFKGMDEDTCGDVLYYALRLC